MDLMTLLVAAVAAAAIFLIAIAIATSGRSSAVSAVERYVSGSEGTTQRNRLNGSTFGRVALIAGLVLAAVWLVLNALLLRA